MFPQTKFIRARIFVALGIIITIILKMENCKSSNNKVFLVILDFEK